jgi:chromosome segregation ATPase
MTAENKQVVEQCESLALAKTSAEDKVGSLSDECELLRGQGAEAVSRVNVLEKECQALRADNVDLVSLNEELRREKRYVLDQNEILERKFDQSLCKVLNLSAPKSWG